MYSLLFEFEYGDHIGLTEFEKINWLPVNDRFE